MADVQNPDRQTFVAHLEELRQRIIKILIAWMILTGFSYFYKEGIFLILIQPLGNLDFQLIHLKVYDKWITYIKISLYAGLILTFPVILYHTSQFILPALYLHEKKWYIGSLMAIMMFFFMGVFFSYKYLMPMSLKFLIQFDSKKNNDPTPNSNPQLSSEEFKKKLNQSIQNLEIIQSKIQNKIQGKALSQNKDLLIGIKNLLEVQKSFHQFLNNIHQKLMSLSQLKNKRANKYQISSYLNVSEYVDWMIFFILVTGFVFQLPLIIIILVKLGIINHQQLIHFRPYAFISILILSALITPPDIVSQVFLAVPVYGLYEISILATKMIRKHHH